MLAALLLSMPAQVLVADKVGEPYPALFQPFFWGTSQTAGGAVRFPFVTLRVDGQRVKPVDVLARGDRQAALARMFPADGGRANVDASTRRSMRRNLAHRLGTEPGELVVRWEERRFHLDTGKATRHKTTATYHIDLRGDRP